MSLSQHHHNFRNITSLTSLTSHVTPLHDVIVSCKLCVQVKCYLFCEWNVRRISFFPFSCMICESCRHLDVPERPACNAHSHVEKNGLLHRYQLKDTGCCVQIIFIATVMYVRYQQFLDDVVIMKVWVGNVDNGRGTLEYVL